MALTDAAQVAHARFILYETPEYLEEAISRTRACLMLTSLEDPMRSNITQNLERLERERLDGFGVTHALPHSHS